MRGKCKPSNTKYKLKPTSRCQSFEVLVLKGRTIGEIYKSENCRSVKSEEDYRNIQIGEL